MKAGILLLIFIVPVAGYLLLRTGTNHYMKLPVFGERQLAANGKDTIYHTVPDFSLIDQKGKPVSQQNIGNNIYVADFFFVTCPTICPKMSTQFSRLQEQFKNEDYIRLVSHTVNPEEDSVPVLAKYGNEYGAIPGKWYLLTGDKQEIYRMAREGYLVNAMQGDGGPDDFIHSELFVLVDKHKRIRGFYDGTSEKDVERLIDEIKLLRLEHLRDESVTN